MTGKRTALLVAALVAIALGAVLALRTPAESPPAPSLPAAAPAEVAAPLPAETADAAIRSTLAADQLDAKQRSELEVVSRIGDELELTAAERDAALAAIKKLQTGRHAQFARLVDGSADEQDVTAGLHALHLAFEADLKKALGPARGADFIARFNAAYGTTFKDKKKTAE